MRAILWQFMQSVTLLFIVLGEELHIVIGRFNTSHVTLYRNRNWEKSFVSNVSIHLMLLFINEAVSKYGSESTFQYISCYSLSHNRYAGTANWAEFQYISCYSLSGYTRVCWKAQWKFQYISCYSLSLLPGLILLCSFRFNTSHVTLYHKTDRTRKCKWHLFQYISCYSLSGTA